MVGKAESALAVYTGQPTAQRAERSPVYIVSFTRRKHTQELFFWLHNPAAVMVLLRDR